MKTPFGINFKPKGGNHEDYKYRECSFFLEISDSIEPKSLREDYCVFVQEWLDGKIKKSTLVDLELLRLFQGDLDNRAQIDYREGHWDDDEVIFSGGEHFDRWAKKLEAHINAA